jgi:hypothetical protein
MFALERREVTGSSRKFHNEEFHKFSSLQDTINLTVLRRVRWAGRAARMRRIHTKLYSVNLRGRNHSGKLSADGRMILNFVLKK